MKSWQHIKIENLAEKVAMGPFGSNIKVSTFISSGVPIISGHHLKNFLVKDCDFNFISEEHAQRLKNSIVYPEDIIFTHAGTIGQVSMISKKSKFPYYIISQRQFFLRCKKDIALPQYITYFFRSKYGQEMLLANVNSTGVPSIAQPASYLKSLIISLPSIKEQKAIVAVLSSLDDKIDLLHRQNATLERMAETLFRQWFIEEAQEEWEVKPLTFIATFLNGLACQKFPPQNSIEKLPVLKIRELNSGISADSDFASSKISKEYIIHSGDVIFSWSGSLLVKIWHGEDCILNQHLFKVYSLKFPKWFYYFWCKHHLAEFTTIAESHATTMGHIKRSDLDAVNVIIPDAKTLNKMSEKIDPLFNKIFTNAKQIQTLEKLRDTLLPKLMSGEVRVRVDE